MMQQWTSRNILLSVLIGLTLFTQACQTNQPTNNSTDSEQPSERRDQANSQENSERDSAERENSRESTQVVTKEVVVVANPLNSLPAELTSKYADSKINIRSKPTTQSRAKHFGYKGDRITLLQEAQTENRYVWYFVEFDKSKAQGWVRGDFVDFLDSPEEADDVIPVDYSGAYVHKSPQTGVITASMDFRQSGKVLQFTAIQQNPACPSELDGEAVFSPDANEFVGSSNDGQFQLTLMPKFLNGQPTGQFKVETRDGKTQERLTENFEACTYDGLYQQK